MMNGTIKQYMKKFSPTCRDEDGENHFYAVFRIIVSLMFFLHGLQKIFGFFGGIDGANGAAQLITVPWWAGIIEIIVGAMILVGMLVRLAALIGIVEMFVAYFFVHLPLGLNPLTNGGELALMYLASFLVIFYYGAGKWSVEKMYHGREWM